MSKTDFYDLKVSKVTQETKDTVSLSFDIPNDLKETFQYKAGQYLTLKFDIDGKEERRAYSFSSSPTTDQAPTVTVKRVKGGLISNHINDNIKEGTTVAVMPANGRFTPTIKEENRINYYLFGGGSGITPLMSIIKTVIEEEPQSVVHLLYGNQDTDSIIFHEVLQDLQSKYAGQIIVDFALDNPPVQKEGGFMGMFQKKKINWNGKVGRIDAAMIKGFLQKHPTNGRNDAYYICGPGPMMEVVKKSLEQQSIDAKKINIEVFTSIGSTVPKKTTNSDVKKVKVHLESKTIDIEVADNETILDVLLKQDEDAPYSCTSGACATCMAKVISGKVEMDACFALDDDEIANGLILTCQSHPVTDSVEITFNN